MKKLVLLLTSLIMAATSSLLASNYNFSAVCESGQTLYYLIHTDNTTVGVYYPGEIEAYYENFTEPSGILTIPSSVTYEGKTYTVTKIESYAFADCEGLTEVVIPNSVTHIGRYAFRNTGLTSFNIPSSVTEIEQYVFNTTAWWDDQYVGIVYKDGWCLGYKGNKVEGILNIESGTVGIVENAFEWTEITKVNFPETLKYIIGSAFQGCLHLRKVVIPNSVVHIGPYAFENSWYIDTLILGNSLTEIGYRTFNGCGIDSVYIPNSVTTIGYMAFGGSSFENLTLPSSLTSIDDEAFYSCSQLTEITIPSTVTNIGSGAFWRCEALETVNFNADSCTSMGSEDRPVFGYCTKFTTLNIGENVKAIPSCAFCHCDSLTSVTLPNSVTAIGAMAFYHCDSLATFNIPNAVTTIGRKVFENTAWWNNQEDGVIYKDGWCLGYKETEPEGTLTIQDETKAIADYAFANCDQLYSLVLPSSVISIGDGAFNGYVYLSTITSNAIVPPSVTSSTFCTYYATLHVPAESEDAYKNHAVWGQFDFPAASYTVTATSENEDMGTVEGSGTYEENEEATLTATPAEGYRFVKWSDENTENPRTITVAEDVTLTAIFEEISEDPDAIAETTFSNAQILGSSKRIIINNATNANVAVYDTMGRTVVKEQRLNSNNEVFAVPQRGMYIVRLGNTATKVLVK